MRHIQYIRYYDRVCLKKVCFCYELFKRGLKYQKQVDIPIVYNGMIFDEGLRLDVLVEELIIYELKAVDEMNPVREAQILNIDW